jgi:hypothetical protein
MRNAIPHHSESQGKTLSESVTIPDVIRDHPMVVRYFSMK